VSDRRGTLDERRAELVARAAAEREALSRQLALLGTLDGGLARLSSMKSRLPGIAMGAGLGLSALLLALPAGRFPLVRGGVALLHFAGSVRRLFSQR